MIPNEPLIPLSDRLQYQDSLGYHFIWLKVAATNKPSTRCCTSRHCYQDGIDIDGTLARSDLQVQQFHLIENVDQTLT